MSWISILGHSILTPRERKRLRQREWYSRNREKVRARQNAKYPERKKYIAEYARANRKRRNELGKRWAKTPRGRAYKNAWMRARYARNKGRDLPLQEHGI